MVRDFEPLVHLRFLTGVHHDASSSSSVCSFLRVDCGQEVALRLSLGSTLSGPLHLTKVSVSCLRISDFPMEESDVAAVGDTECSPAHVSPFLFLVPLALCLTLTLLSVSLSLSSLSLASQSGASSFKHSLVARDAVLTPGSDNEVTVTGALPAQGTYYVSRVCLSFHRLRFMQTILPCHSVFISAHPSKLPFTLTMLRSNCSVSFFLSLLCVNRLTLC